MTSEESAQPVMIAEKPRLTVVPTDQDVAMLAADRVAEVLAVDPSAAVSLPTGSTPLGMFREILRRVKTGSMDISKMNLFLLDEYLGQTIEDEASLTNWLSQEFLEPANIHEHVHYVPSAEPDPVAAAAAYEADLAAHGGLRLAVLGLGPNGHIAFNEPGSTADSRTRVLELTPESRDQSSAYWDGREKIPAMAMTVGVGTLLESDQIVLIVTGSNKAEILRKALEEPMSADVPASWLRLASDRLEIIADEAAASRLTITSPGTS